MKAAGLAKYLHSQCWVYPEVKMSGSPHKKGDLDKEGRTVSCSPSMPTGPINAVAVCRLLYTTLLRKDCRELFSVHFVLKNQLTKPGRSSENPVIHLGVRGLWHCSSIAITSCSGCHPDSLQSSLEGVNYLRRSKISHMGEQEKHSSEKIKAQESKTYLTELDEIPMPSKVCDRESIKMCNQVAVDLLYLQMSSLIHLFHIVKGLHTL